MEANPRLKILYSAARDGKCAEVRRLIISFQLHKKERFDLYCLAVIDGEKEVATSLLYNGSQAQEGYSAKKAKDEIIETLIEKMLTVDEFPASFFMDLAINEGHEELVLPLLSKGADINAKVSGPFTAIQLAVMKGHSKIVNILLDDKANVDSIHEGSSLLHTAVIRGDLKTVALLLKYCASVNATTCDGFTALYIAAQKGFVEIAEKLIAAGADVRDKMPIIGEKDQLWEKFKAYLSELKNDPGSRYWHRPNPDYDSYEEEYRGVIHEDDYTGWTPLHAAAEKGHNKIVELLLKNGAEIDAYDNLYRRPLYIAALSGHERTVKLLCDRGANITWQDTFRQTPLHYFVLGACLESAKIVLNCGGEIDVANFLGQTPLFLAVELGEINMVKFLLHRGAITLDHRNNTPVHAAASRGLVEVVQFLLNYGIDVEAVNEDGETALHIAARKGFEPLIRLLLERGAKVDAVHGKNGKSALFAVEKAHLECINTLLEFGASTGAEYSGSHKSGSTIHKSWNTQGRPEDSFCTFRASARQKVTEGGWLNFSRTTKNILIFLLVAIVLDFILTE